MEYKDAAFDSKPEFAADIIQPKSQLNLDKIIAYEQGDLDEDETVDLFQELVTSGLAWQLQGHYGRTAVAMIKAGVIALPKEA